MFKIAIGAGHGLYTPGKRTLKSLDPKQTREWSLNNRIVSGVERELKKYKNVQVLRVDDRTGKRDVPLAERVRKVNNFNPDVFVSYHHDAGIGGGYGGGISVHRAKGSSYATQKYQKSLYNELIKATNLKGNRSNPMPLNNFYVVRNTKCPSVLVEHGFMDSRTDLPIILSQKFVNDAIQGHINFYVKEFNLKLKNGVSPAPSKPKPKINYVRMGDKGDSIIDIKQLQQDLIYLGYGDNLKEPNGVFGALTHDAVVALQSDNMDKANGAVGPKTQRVIDKLKKEKEEEKKADKELYKVQVGAYGVKDNADKKLENLKDKGFDGYIKKE